MKSGSKLSGEKKISELEDDELVAEAKSLYEHVNVLEQYDRRTLQRYEAAIAELQRRGFKKVETVDFKKVQDYDIEK